MEFIYGKKLGIGIELDLTLLHVVISRYKYNESIIHIRKANSKIRVG